MCFLPKSRGDLCRVLLHEQRLHVGVLVVLEPGQVEVVCEAAPEELCAAHRDAVSLGDGLGRKGEVVVSSGGR